LARRASPVWCRAELRMILSHLYLRPVRVAGLTQAFPGAEPAIAWALPKLRLARVLRLCRRLTPNERPTHGALRRQRQPDFLEPGPRAAPRVITVFALDFVTEN